MFLMYVDESGDSGFPAPGMSFPESGGPTRYFVRAGVIVHAWKWATINERINQFKQSRMIEWDAELRAHDIRSGKRAFMRWTPSDRSVLMCDLLDTIGKELDISILATVIDKQLVDPQRKKRISDPSVRSLELLLERYNLFLGEQKDRCGIVILDSVGRGSDENLRYFQSYLRKFSSNLDSRRIVEGTLFAPSHTTNFLQLADVCANVIFRYYSGEFLQASEYQRIEPRVFRVKVWP